MHSIEISDVPGTVREFIVSVAATNNPLEWRQAGSLAEASVICRTYIAQRRLRPEDWKGGEVRESGDTVARVAFNGRVWATIPCAVRRVAAMFSALLREHVGEDGMCEIARLNSIETAACVCHSHDFVDANMVMLDAIARIIGPHPDGESPAAMWLFESAWQVARASWTAPQRRSQSSQEVGPTGGPPKSERPVVAGPTTREIPRFPAETAVRE